MYARRVIIASAATAIVSLLVVRFPSRAAEWEVRDIAFPVQGKVTFRDDFGEPRAGHAHEGNDLMGAKMMPLLSAVDGYVRYIVIPEASWGYAVYIQDRDGYTYNYLHINNDTPGTDDGNGGTVYAYAPGIYENALVKRGQLIGWMGDSGNAESAGPHLHFEIRRPDDTPISPYQSLLAALSKGAYVPADVLAASPNINTDKGLQPAGGAPACTSGTRIKTAGSKAVYYCGADGKRYVFPNDRAYYTWYPDFTGVTVVTADVLASIPLGGNVTYRPGAKMVKIQSDPRVFAVDHGGTLRWIASPDIAAALYGADWAKKVDDVSDAFFINYKSGEPINSAQ
ncbi:MAG TPA: peptidoglycan DD-metalloendopeptidase family protein [Candidatus Eisenbacteria bacterium]|nr:peptidoglycan DD-metalloendopeptidase family protein [Candidatus Eisenbacteria bacterium]